MKRNDQQVPGFDEIIFENRNKGYGAYDLRKRYKSAITFSLISGVSICAIPLILILVFSPEPVEAKFDPGVFVVVRPDNLIDPSKITPPEPEKPVQAPPQYKYIAPKIVDDSLGLPDMIITDLAMDSVQNDKVLPEIDSVTYAPPVTDTSEEQEPLIFVQEQPLFPGGNDALLKYVAEHTNYPAEALENNIQGRVFVKFVVTARGSIERIEVTRSLHPLLDAEAVRVISALPAWKPGRQNGKAVPVWFSMPVTFQILIN